MIISQMDLIRQAMVIRREIKNLQALTEIYFPSGHSLDTLKSTTISAVSYEEAVGLLEVNINLYLSNFSSEPDLKNI